LRGVRRARAVRFHVARSVAGCDHLRSRGNGIRASQGGRRMKRNRIYMGLVAGTLVATIGPVLGAVSSGSGNQTTSYTITVRESGQGTWGGDPGPTFSRYFTFEVDAHGHADAQFPKDAKHNRIFDITHAEDVSGAATATEYRCSFATGTCNPAVTWRGTIAPSAPSAAFVLRPDGEALFHGTLSNSAGATCAFDVTWNGGLAPP